jgi:hypothetical protein
MSTARPKPAASPARSVNHTRERAEFWRVDIRTMQRLKARRPPVPVDDVEAMIVWYSRLPADAQNKLTATFRSRILELRNGSSNYADPDFVEFEANYKADSDPTASLQVFQKQRAYWAFKLTRAQQHHDEAAIDFATKQLIRFESAIHDAQLRAQRLGIDQGDLLPRAEHERISRAVAYWLMRGLDSAALEISARVSTATAAGPITPEELHQYLEPILLRHCFLTPLTRATQVAAATTLPAWVVAAYREAVDDSLESGAQLFAELHATQPEPVKIQVSNAPQSVPRTL